MIYLQTFRLMGFHAGVNGGFPVSPKGFTFAQMQAYEDGYSKGWDVRDALEAI